MRAAPSAVNHRRAQRRDYAGLLPVRVVLRDFAARGLPPIGQAASVDRLWQFISAELPEALRDAITPLRDELRLRGGLLLLDGMDEVPEADSATSK